MRAGLLPHFHFFLLLCVRNRVALSPPFLKIRAASHSLHIISHPQRHHHAAVDRARGRAPAAGPLPAPPSPGPGCTLRAPEAGDPPAGHRARQARLLHRGPLLGAGAGAAAQAPVALRGRALHVPAGGRAEQQGRPGAAAERARRGGRHGGTLPPQRAHVPVAVAGPVQDRLPGVLPQLQHQVQVPAALPQPQRGHGPGGRRRLVSHPAGRTAPFSFNVTAEKRRHKLSF